MKKIFLSVFFAMIGMCVFAQKGDFAVGVNVGYAPVVESGANLSNIGIGAKAQYNVTNPLRLEVGANYWLKSKEINMFDLAVNAHYLIPITEKIKVYPLVGIGYFHIGGGASEASTYEDSRASWFDDIDNDDDDDDISDYDGKSSSSNSKILCNIGVGAEYALTPNLSVGVEVKYQYVKDCSRLPISIGLTYKF
jgi:outer membrane protein X